MANQYFRKGRGGRVSDKYSRRVASVGKETARLRGDVSKLLVQGLRDATKQELYDRTPLDVSEDMMKAIRPKLAGNVVEVGFTYGHGATYARYRLNMTGISPSGGHRLDMRPAEWIKKNVQPKFDKATRAAQRRIIGD